MTQQALLQEIFMPAAPLMKNLPFSAEVKQASCSGHCKSGTCMAVESTDVLPANFYA